MIGDVFEKPKGQVFCLPFLEKMVCFAKTCAGIPLLPVVTSLWRACGYRSSCS
jgi:hypothetical protein